MSALEKSLRAIAGGFSPATAQPFLTTIQARIAQAVSIGAAVDDETQKAR